MFGMLPFNRSEDNIFDAFDKFFSQSKVEVPAFRTDIRNAEDAYLLEAELPGFAKEDIALDIKDGILTIRAESQVAKEEKDEKGNYIRRERALVPSAAVLMCLELTKRASAHSIRMGS